MNQVTQTLLTADGDYFTDLVEGEFRFGSAPLLDCYFAMGHTNLLSSLRQVQNFIEKAQYPEQDAVSPVEVGSIGNLRFLLSSRGSVEQNASLLGNDVFNVFCVAQDSYAIIEQTSQRAGFIYHPPGWGDDPSELRQTAAVRFAQVPKITNSAWVINFRSTAA